MAVINPLERKLAKRTSEECYVHLFICSWVVAGRHLSIGARIDLLFEIYALFFFSQSRYNAFICSPPCITAHCLMLVPVLCTVGL